MEVIAELIGKLPDIEVGVSGEVAGGPIFLLKVAVFAVNCISIVLAGRR